jgi:acyl-CoA synthetase (AMP-forming)/AMP-acid ligase II
VRAANVASRLAERAARHPDRTAITEYRHGRRRSITFGELALRVAALGAGFRAAGVVPGDRVLVFVPMSIDLYAVLLGCLHAGATAVFVDAWADRRRLDHAVHTARPRVFVGTPKAHLLRLISSAVRRIPVLWIAGARCLRVSRYERPADAPAETADPDAHALITFTTGSTGTPKVAARSHAFLWAQHQALAAHLQLTEADVDMPTLPVFVLNNLALGVASVLPEFDPRRPGEADPARIFPQMLAEGVTTSSGSPAFYARLLAGGKALPLRAVWTGGAPVYSPFAAQLARGVQGEAHVVYGSTEAEPIAGIEARDMLAAMREDSGGGICVGPPVPGIRLRLIRPHDAPVKLAGGGWASWEVEPGETGEVVVTGAHVLGRYLDQPEEDRRHKIRDGSTIWHRTGDAARLDEQGRLWLMGRTSERVQRGGEVWWSTPAETRALSLDGVSHAAFLGMPHPELGQRAVLCLECAGPITAEVVRDALQPTPVDEVVVLRHIPRDPRHASKTDTAALRQLLSRRTN